MSESESRAKSAALTVANSAPFTVTGRPLPRLQFNFPDGTPYCLFPLPLLGSNVWTAEVSSLHWRTQYHASLDRKLNRK